MIEECIENIEKALIYTKNTTIHLSKSGDCFFMAHIEENKRYLRLVDIYADFIHRTVAKTKQVEDMTKVADLLEQNKDKVK